MEDRENITQSSEGISEEIGVETPLCNMNIQINEEEGVTKNQQENPKIENLQEGVHQRIEEVCPISHEESTQQNKDVVKEHPTTNTDMVLY